MSGRSAWRAGSRRLRQLPRAAVGAAVAVINLQNKLCVQLRGQLEGQLRRQLWWQLSGQLYWELSERLEGKINGGHKATE